MRLLFFSICSLLFLTGFRPDNQEASLIRQGEDEVKYLYVYAPNGLNMRDGPELSYNKLIKIPYGAKVELIHHAEDQSLVVDGLTGGMAKLSYGGYTGYAFEGYLNKYRAPEKNMEARKYVDKLRSDGHLVYYEKTERDYDGYFQFEEAIILHECEWEDAFLVAKQLFRIPPKLYFPPTSNKSEDKFENPDKAEYAWSDEMSAKRVEGIIAEISYYYRGEGSGHSVTIKPDKDNPEAFRITDLGIAD